MPDLSENTAIIPLILILVIGFGSLLFGDFNNPFARAVRQLLVWGAIFASATIVFTFRDDITAGLTPMPQTLGEGGEIELARARDGHFYARLTINGTEIPFVVDTGATHMVLSKEDAEKVGIDTSALVFIGRANTANGVVRTARVRLGEVAFGGQVDRRVRATVNGGELQTSLLGMSYLDRFSKIEIARDTMTLVP